MAKDTFRVVTRGPDGKIRMRDYDAPDTLLRMHTQIGVDDCSTDLGLRGQPVFRGLIGPMPEGKNVIRYESPEVFETLTKEWSAANKVAAAVVPTPTSAKCCTSATQSRRSRLPNRNPQIPKHKPRNGHSWALFI